MIDPKTFIFSFFDRKVSSKYVVLLFDDFGTIRINNGYEKKEPFENRFNRLDGIANSKDLTALFEVLNSVKDSQGNPAVITPMTVVANPDFQKIEDSEFQEYHYETFFETLKRKEDANEILKLWKEGIEQGFFVPEYHGREHLNVRFWMRVLQAKDEAVLSAFREKSIGILPKNRALPKYMEAFDIENEDHLNEVTNIANDGLKIFEQMFGYRSVFFTPPGLIHNNGMHESFSESGIKAIDMARSRIMPKVNGKRTRRIHYMGQKNKYEQVYITRNVMFEPNIQNGENWVNLGLKGIEIAFKYEQPAIVSSHRVNFVGCKDPKIRDAGLRDLKLILNGIVKTWPDVQFIPVRSLVKSYVN